ncbi:hypothetical protein sS8_2318 [Methylocaldum marinum]|uniref:Uncharacterized protein n=1 Tax=Methylocaldum marinum TaxID=1432792 RepID=A0A250KRI8_9GAMM|nr:iron chelate uptake ABC transporter family permease subunit [Methylocaldum marinum]BBA34270.1 hypothetical protein sS8_2318 [Methylocaldum marinum]
MNPALSLASILLLLLLTACDRSTPDSAAPDLGSRNMTDAVWRAVRIPAASQRILALSELDLDALLALGLRPTGAANARGGERPPAYLGTRAAGIESLGNFAQPSLGRIVVLQPDLILAGGQADPERLTQLETIALAGGLTPGAQIGWALSGALTGSAFALMLAHAGRGQASPLRLVLAGLAIGATCQSLTAWLSLASSANLDQFRFWLLGSLTHPHAGLAEHPGRSDSTATAVRGAGGRLRARMRRRPAAGACA